MRHLRIAQGQLGGQNVGVSDRRCHLVHSRQRLSCRDGHSVRARRPEYNHSGVILLIQQDMFGLAFVVFFASIAVPVIKLAYFLARLSSAVRRGC